MASEISSASRVCSSKMSIDENCDSCKEKLSGTIKMLDCYHLFHKACFEKSLSDQDKSACRICKSNVTVISPEMPQESRGLKRKREQNPLRDLKMQNALANALVAVADQKDLPDEIQEKVTRRFLHKEFPFLSDPEMTKILVVRSALSIVVARNGNALSFSESRYTIDRLLNCTNSLLSPSLEKEPQK